MSAKKQVIEKNPAKERHRVTCTLWEDEYQRLSYYAKKRKQTINDLLADAIEFFIAYENGDYNLPALEIQRLNQLVDAVNGCSVNLRALEQVTVRGFKSLTELARGQNYLLEEGDGIS